MAAMTWSAWGDEGVRFTADDKPALGPFLEKALGLDLRRIDAPSARFEDVDVPEPTLNPALHTALERCVGADHVSLDGRDRVVHARGKSLRDLLRHRAGQVGRIPDVVVRPADEDQIAAVLAEALEADAVLIPFGGGTNISGSLEAPAEETRTVISLDLARLDRVLEVDAASRLARVQPGVFGPDLERQLNALGWTLGHYPDSFTHSTLGGWIATRSSGMQSDKYGDVADLTRGVRVVTPAGMLVVDPIPVTSTGPSVREMILGSEGRLGIISEATVQVHRVPEERVILGYLFPSWKDGLAAMQELAGSEAEPSITRVSDRYETAFSFATKKGNALVDRLKSRALREFLERRKGFDVAQMCLSFIGFEGSPRHVALQRRLTAKVVAGHGGVCIGRGPGELYDQKKFDTPYIRDYLLDRGALADVSETAAPWSVLPHVYDTVMAAARGAFDGLGVTGYIMSHLSHSYHAGACLYFTFAFTPAAGRDGLEEYEVVKSAVQQTFVDNGATLSHHHAVGTEHARWLEQDISAPGVTLVRALFDAVDPGANLNPGKIVGAEKPAATAG